MRLVYVPIISWYNFFFNNWRRNQLIQTLFSVLLDYTFTKTVVLQNTLPGRSMIGRCRL